MRKHKNEMASGHASKALGSPKSIGKVGRSLKSSVKSSSKVNGKSKTKSTGRVLKEARQIGPSQINGSDLDSSSARYRR